MLTQWFISEQVEEEENAKLIVDQLELAGDSGSALLILDRELGARSPGEKGEGAATWKQRDQPGIAGLLFG